MLEHVIFTVAFAAFQGIAVFIQLGLLYYFRKDVLSDNRVLVKDSKT